MHIGFFFVERSTLTSLFSTILTYLGVSEMYQKPDYAPIENKEIELKS